METIIIRSDAVLTPRDDGFFDARPGDVTSVCGVCGGESTQAFADHNAYETGETCRGCDSTGLEPPDATDQFEAACARGTYGPTVTY